MLHHRLSITAERAPRSIINRCSLTAKVQRPLRVGLSISTTLKRFELQGIRALASFASQEPKIISSSIAVDEEKLPGYNSEAYYPASPGEILKGRYQLITKIGWGSSSTVWLAHDLRSWPVSKTYVAIKICNGDLSPEDMIHELNMNVQASFADPAHRGSRFLGTAIAGYNIQSSSGKIHLALVFEPLREPLWLFRKRITKQDSVPYESLPLFKNHLRLILKGLDYMHSEANIVHTDLNLDNIMVTFEDHETIDTFARKQAAHPMARKDVGGRVVYRSHNNFGPISKGLAKMTPKITDFGHARRCDGEELGIRPIQSNGLRAPEVILGTGWSYSAEVWNFGAMVWELLAGQSLFAQPNTHPYSAAQHLADMIALIGDVPTSLIHREREMRSLRLLPALRNPDGRLCTSVAEYYGGPFFAADRTFLHEDMIPCDRNMAKELPGCIFEENQVELFVDFMAKMLRWVPEERASAGELLRDPWLNLKQGGDPGIKMKS